MKKVLMILMLVMCCPYGFAQKNPVYNNGVQYELEAGIIGGSITFSYKYAKRFSAGVGFWYGANLIFQNELEQNVTTEYKYYRTDLFTEDKYPRTTKWTNEQDAPDFRPINKIFINGQIRPMDRVFSFIFGANLGIETIKLEDYWYPHYDKRQSVPFITPYTGISIRTGKNIYLSLKMGGSIAGSIKSEGTVVEKRDIFYNYFPNTKIYLGNS